MAPQQPKRRKSDLTEIHKAIWTAAKATIAFIFFGVLSFVGSWGIDMGKSVAKLKEDVEVIKEKEAMTVQMIYPQLMEKISQMQQEIKEMQLEVHQIAREQARRTGIINRMDKRG